MSPLAALAGSVAVCDVPVPVLNDLLRNVAAIYTPENMDQSEATWLRIEASDTSVTTERPLKS